MCPPDEYEIRKEHNLVRPFETSFLSAVKCYSRSAAGQSAARHKNIRDLTTLENTVKYLFEQVLDRRKTSLAQLYDFVFDRLRAVRQDLVVQGYLEGFSGLRTVTVAKILEYCVRFYIYFQFRLSHLPASAFSSHLNQNHLDECLSQLLHLYSEIEVKNQDLLHQTSHIEIEALDLLLSKNSAGLHRALQLPSKTKSNTIVRNSIEISISLWLGNFVRANHIARGLPLSLQLAYRAHFSLLRPRVLEVYERGYRSPQGTKFPLEKLRRYLLFDTARQTAEFCVDCGLSLDDTGSSVIFKTGTALKFSTTSQSNDLYDQDFEETLENVRVSHFLYGQSI